MKLFRALFPKKRELKSRLCPFYDENALHYFPPGNRAEVFIWQNFQPAYRDPGWKNRDLGNRASPLSHMNTSRFF